MWQARACHTCISEARPIRFQFHPNQSLDKNIRRGSVALADKALRHLIASYTDRDEAIHQARRCCKRIRSLLRLIRTELPRKIFRTENRCYRDIGRSLGAVRDSFAVLQTFDRLMQARARERQWQTAREFRRILLAGHALRWIDTDDLIENAIEAIASARERITEWPTMQEHPSRLPGGLFVTYERCQSTQMQEPSTAHLHTWRKEVRNLFEQVRWLNPIAPQALEDYTQELKELESHLSEWHDLAVLRTWLLTAAAELWPFEQIEPSTQLIEQRQTALCAFIKPLGEHLFAESPKAFRQRMNGYWKERRN